MEGRGEISEGLSNSVVTRSGSCFTKMAHGGRSRREGGGGSARTSTEAEGQAWASKVGIEGMMST